MFKIQHKRRREKKTNYKSRLALVKAGKPRLVIRKSLNNISVQFIDYKPDGDITIASAFSTELKKFGWKSLAGNIPAAYLTGYLAGRRAKNKKVVEAIMDLGLQRSTRGSRIYGALKGVLDAGVKIPHSENILPTEERIKGKYISDKIVKQFEDVKKKISE